MVGRWRKMEKRVAEKLREQRKARAAEAREWREARDAWRRGPDPTPEQAAEFARLLAELDAEEEAKLAP